MKTIEVSDEQYDFLKEVKELLATQNNRCTCDPLYCIMEKKRIHGLDSDFSSDFVWTHDGEYLCENSNDVFTYLKDCFEDNTLIDLYENCGFEVGKSFDEVIEVLNEETDVNYLIDDWLKENNIYKTYYKDETELSQSSNIFSIFEKDAIEYVESRGGRSTQLHDYAVSTWRAKRMCKLIDLLKEIV